MADSDITDADIAPSTDRSSSKLDCIAVRRGNAVRDRNILAELRGRSLESYGVILAVKDTIGHNHIARLYVNTVIVVVTV